MKCKDGDNRIFITVNGAHGYVFAENELFVNIDSVKEASRSVIDENIVKGENLCTLTRELKITGYKIAGYKQTVRKLIHEQEKRFVWIDTKFLKNFEDFSKFYQEKENGIVVVVEDNEIVGGIMPIKMEESDYE